MAFVNFNLAVVELDAISNLVLFTRPEDSINC